MDWNELWKRNQRQGKKFGQREYWDKRAPSFTKQAAEGGYARPFVEIVSRSEIGRCWMWGAVGELWLCRWRMWCAR